MNIGRYTQIYLSHDNYGVGVCWNIHYKYGPLIVCTKNSEKRENFQRSPDPLDYMPDEDMLQKYRLPRNNIITLGTPTTVTYVTVVIQDGGR